MSRTYKVPNTRALIKTCLDLEYFEPNADGVTPIAVKHNPGEGKLIVAVGDNASGKSFFRRIVQGVCSRAKTEVIHLSMEGRRNCAYNPGLSFVYGSEDWQSTGENSSETVLGAIRTSKGRENPHVIFWDEPDIGLSDSWAASVGVTIREFIQEAPDKLIGAVVVTHNKALLNELVGIPHEFLCFSEAPTDTLAEWLKRKPHIRSLEGLKKDSHRRFKLIQAILNAKKV